MTRSCNACLRRAWLLARLAPHIERATMDTPGSRARDVLALGDEELVAAVAGKLRRSILDEAPGRSAAAVRSGLRAAGVWATCLHEDSYPSRLRELEAEAPRALFGRGSLGLVREIGSELAVTVVGSRRASPYGRGVARELGRLLAASGLGVISGLAYGIDAAAHSGALAAGRSVLAVLGSGPDVPYPSGNRDLYARIVAAGAVISEMPPGSRPFRWSFPARNRTMAALGAMTVVVEAAERSGSLITTDYAARLGRHVGAVPGPVTSWRSQGTNALLADGADLVRDAQDVLDRLLGVGRIAVRVAGPPVERELTEILAAVEAGHASSDAVAVATGHPASGVATGLARLELLGYLRADAAGRYSRTALALPTPQRP